MSWMQRLYESYEPILSQGDGNRPWRVGHVKKNAHIEIILNIEGEFLDARQLNGDEVSTLIPVTEKSSARTGNIEPHPLAEELSYCAFDLPNVKKKTERNQSYLKLLSSWADSPYGHPKISAVLKYINKSVLWSDLNKRFEFPLTLKTKATQKIEPEKCFVRWRVEDSRYVDSSTWNDEEIIQCWIKFEEQVNPKIGFCYISGTEDIRVAKFHSKFLRNAADGARFITQNDWDGFTFLGRFTDSKNEIENNANSQVCEVSYEVSQKAHNALRWLIARQGVPSSDQVIVAWALSGQLIPNPVEDPYSYLSDDEDEPLSQVKDNPSDDEFVGIDHSQNLGATFADKLKLKMKGYQQTLEAHEQISIMALDSATPGRMSVTYYRECLQEEYFEALDAWYTDFAWFQRHTKEIPVDGKKPKHKVIWPVVSPSPLSIAQATFGQRLTDALKKQVYARVLPCITEKANIPLDILNQCVRQASNPAGLDEWEWERNVGVACALYRGFYLRHSNLNERRNFTMALDTTITSRDYLYGRLLAVAERMESIALSVAGEKRRTTAERFMQQFSERPFSTWEHIEVALTPYKARLHNSRAGFLHNREEEITDIVNLFAPNDFCNDSKLSGEFLLGYHCQKMTYRKNKEEQNEVSTETTESVN